MCSNGKQVKDPCCESPETTDLYNPDESETRPLVRAALIIIPQKNIVLSRKGM